MAFQPPDMPLVEPRNSLNFTQLVKFLECWGLSIVQTTLQKLGNPSREMFRCINLHMEFLLEVNDCSTPFMPLKSFPPGDDLNACLSVSF